MNETAQKIISDKEDIINDLELTDDEFFEKQESLNCKSGQGFCKGSQDMFGIYGTAEWRDYTVDKALGTALENAAKYFINRTPEYVLQIIKDRDFIRSFLAMLRSEGTSLPIKDLQEIISKPAL